MSDEVESVKVVSGNKELQSMGNEEWRMYCSMDALNPEVQNNLHSCGALVITQVVKSFPCRE